jgi:hypothetical protein
MSLICATGKRNPNYKLATEHEYVKKIPAVKSPAQVTALD